MIIKYVSDDFHQIFKSENIEGYVHSVFNKVINLMVLDLLVTIGIPTIGMGPSTAIISKNINFLDLGIKQNMGFKKNNKQIVFENYPFTIKYEHFEIWNSSPLNNFMKVSKEVLKNKMIIVENFLFYEGDKNSISSLIMRLKKEFVWLGEVQDYATRILEPNMEFIIDRFYRLIKAVEENQWNKISELSKDIVGFGPGLTPSSDDFLLGLMTGLLYTSDNYQKTILNHQYFVKSIYNKTTSISYQALIHASNGKVNQIIRDSVIYILSNHSIDMMIEKLRKLIMIGQTSGTDILTGVFIGIRLGIYKNSIYKYKV